MTFADDILARDEEITLEQAVLLVVEGLRAMAGARLEGPPAPDYDAQQAEAAAAVVDRAIHAGVARMEADHGDPDGAAPEPQRTT